MRTFFQIDLLVQSVQIQDSDFSKKITGFHRREHFAVLADNLKDSVGDDEHLSRHFTFPAYRIARREYVGLHFQDQISQEFRLALLEYCYLETNDNFK